MTFAAIIPVLLTACSSSVFPGATPAASSATPTLAIPAATSAAPTVGTASPSAPPTPTPITELSQVFRPLATGWRPTGPTLVIAQQSDSGEATLVAVPLGPTGRTGAPTPLVRLPTSGSWALRSDGGAVVIGVSTAKGARLAIWDVPSGRARWLTSDDAGGGSPIWSKDGSSIYYSGSTDDGRAGFFQIGADGSGRKQVFTHERLGQIEGLTPDGKGLVWSRGQAGGSVDIVDLATGVNRQLEGNARVASWRVLQPRLLLSVGGCCAGGPGGSLVAWDDVAMTSRVAAEIGQSGDPAWGMGAWEPSGSQIAAVRWQGTSPRESDLVILDTRTGATRPLAGTMGVGRVDWMPEGIVFAITRTRQARFELMLFPSVGGSAVTLYEDAVYILRIDVIRP
ncbi:MAG: TolB family protein [Candidatus Limnocylindria bacterium]